MITNHHHHSSSSSKESHLACIQMLLHEAYRFHHQSLHGRQSIASVYKQVSMLWDQMSGTPDQKYEFIRHRLTALFLWDRSTDGLHRDLLSPPLQLLELYRKHQAERLCSLPDGNLFYGEDPDHQSMHEEHDSVRHHNSIIRPTMIATR